MFRFIGQFRRKLRGRTQKQYEQDRDTYGTDTPFGQYYDQLLRGRGSLSNNRDDLLRRKKEKRAREMTELAIARLAQGVEWVYGSGLQQGGIGSIGFHDSDHADAELPMELVEQYAFQYNLPPHPVLKPNPNQLLNQIPDRKGYNQELNEAIETAISMYENTALADEMNTSLYKAIMARKRRLPKLHQDLINIARLLPDNHDTVDLNTLYDKYRPQLYDPNSRYVKLMRDRKNDKN